MKKEINIPDTINIHVSGPVQTGKSIVMHRIKEILEKEFSATVVLNDELKRDFNANNYSNLDDWQKKMVRQGIWVLTE